nr:hypothetical protein Iba_chr05eCG9270 [Ipomoea batatas]
MGGDRNPPRATRRNELAGKGVQGKVILKEPDVISIGSQAPRKTRNDRPYLHNEYEYLRIITMKTAMQRRNHTGGLRIGGVEINRLGVGRAEVGQGGVVVGGNDVVFVLALEIGQDLDFYRDRNSGRPRIDARIKFEGNF